MGDYDWIGPLIGEVGKGVNSYASADKANGQTQAAFDEMLRNLKARFGDYDALGKAGYQDVTAQQVGPSALEGIPQDLQARGAQQQSIAALEELAANGGLSLADMKALNDIQANLNRNNTARRKGLANEFAARGQLGAGAQLAMGLDAQQNDAQNANQRAESTAAQAQARALQAILQKGQIARGMGNDDYNRKADAARARDMIEARNAAARTDASKTNNAYRGQAFQDEMSKARGKTSLTNSMNQAVFGKGEANRNTTLGQASATSGVIDAGAGAWGSFGGSGSDIPANEQTAQDLADEAETNRDDD